jgi:hypothetical protein
MYPTNFIGENLSDQECDTIALSRFKHTLFKDEAQRQQDCWFDYRFMHPILRTYLFAHYYQRAYKATYEKYIDIDSAHVIGLSRPQDPLDNRPSSKSPSRLRTPTCLIRARQIADELSIPYDFYTMNSLRFLMKSRHADKMVGQTRDGKLRLNIQASAIYSEYIVLDVLEKWKAYTDARMVWVENPDLCFDESTNHHPYKLEMERYYLKQIITRTNKSFPLESAVDKRLVRQQTAENFGKRFDLSW